MSGNSIPLRITRRRIAPFAIAIAILVTSGIVTGSAAAEQIKIGLSKTTGAGPTFIAIERGYFTNEGLVPELVYFDVA